MLLHSFQRVILFVVIAQCQLSHTHSHFLVTLTTFMHCPHSSACLLPWDCNAAALPIGITLIDNITAHKKLEEVLIFE